MGNRNVQMEAHVVNFPRDNMVVVLFQKQSVAVITFTAVQMDTLAMFLREPVAQESREYTHINKAASIDENTGWKQRYLPRWAIGMPKMETRVVNSPQDNGVVALFHKQSAAVMDVHCCPNGYTCDVSEGTCSQESREYTHINKAASIEENTGWKQRYLPWWAIGMSRGKHML